MLEGRGMSPPQTARPLTVVCGGALVPSARFRVQPVAERLRARGWAPRVVYGYGEVDARLPAGLPRTAYRAACRVKRAVQTAWPPGGGPILLQKLALPWTAAPERIAAGGRRPVVFDFDDAIFIGSSPELTRLRARAVREACAAADRVVAGNSWLAAFVDDPKVSVIPTCIDTEVYAPGPAADGEGEPVVGWIGTAGNFPYLDQLEAPLRRLRQAGFRFRFVICSDRRDPALFERLGAEFIPWSAAAELDILRAFDIGLMPLADDDWCRGKCSFKLIQYMAVGKPVVASAVGMNLDVVSEGMDGFLVDEAGWYEPLAALLADAGRRAAMGASARQTAVARFSVDTAAAAYDAILRAL